MGSPSEGNADGAGSARLLLAAPTAAPHALCEVLLDAGVEQVLGVPGGDVVAVFDALRDYSDRIRVSLVRDEALAGVMAEAYGRVRRRPCVLLAQGIWVLAHATMGALEALTGSSPMVIVADVSDKIPFSTHNPTQSGTGEPGNWNAALAFRGFSKHVLEAHDPLQMVVQLQLALRLAMSGTPGPVSVLLYSASLRGLVGPDSRPPVFTRGDPAPPPARAEPGAVRAAARTLAAARSPVVIAGNGARVSGADVTGFAERTGLPVVTTSAGKGVLAEDHPLAGGVVGEFGLDAANDLVSTADVVLAVGTRLGPGDTVRANPAFLNPTRQQIIQVDVAAERIGWSVPAVVGLVGDAAAVLEQLGDELTRRPDAGAHTGAARVRAAFQASGSFEVPASASAEVPVLPQRIIAALSACLPANAVVTADAGENRIFLVHYFRTRSAGGFLQPGSTGGMGYALPAAMGAKMAVPDRPVVAVAGDGGFGMSLAGLLTARELGLAVVVVVLNNQMLGWVQHVQGDRRIASELGAFDYAAIARAMGCGGTRVSTAAEFEDALADALAADRPWVIDVVTSPAPSWRDVSSRLATAGRGNVSNS